MARRFGRTTALKSLVVPGVFYLSLAFCTGYLFWPYFYYMKNETLIVLGAFAIWRYGWQAVAGCPYRVRSTRRRLCQYKESCHSRGFPI